MHLNTLSPFRLLIMVISLSCANGEEALAPLEVLKLFDIKEFIVLEKENPDLLGKSVHFYHKYGELESVYNESNGKVENGKITIYLANINDNRFSVHGYVKIGNGHSRFDLRTSLYGRWEAGLPESSLMHQVKWSLPCKREKNKIIIMQRDVIGQDSGKINEEYGIIFK